ncbi:zeta toxin family protein [Streptomyces virginiae]
MCSDLYKPVHPRYADYLADDVRTAGVKVRPGTRRWQAALEDHVRAHGFDAVVESALADPAEFRTSATAYRQAGHRIEVVGVATAEAWSQLGLVDRFLSEAIDGGGRYVSWENHDTCDRQMHVTLAVIEALPQPVRGVQQGAEHHVRLRHPRQVPTHRESLRDPVSSPCKRSSRSPAVVPASAMTSSSARRVRAVRPGPC